MCTRVLWGDANGAVLVGRNMDYHRDLATNLWKLPRGIKRDDGVNGALSWTARYGSVAITALDMMTVDGLNEAGLSGHILWLAESVYGEYDASRPVLSQAIWLQYFLDNYANVAEAVAWVKENHTQVFQLVDPASGEVPAIHLALDDASGDSAIFEYIDGELRIHHSPDHQVMTNSPPYDQQLEMLKQVQGFGGTLSLPGSTLASDRFARAAYYVNRLARPKSQVEAIAAMFSVMRNVAQPFRVPDPGKPDASQTIWQSVADLTRRRLVFESTTRPNIIWVDLDGLNFAADSGESKIDLGSQLAVEGGLAGDVTDKFTPASGLKFLDLTMLKQLKARAAAKA
ncbi:linear amide C-N hydrolase [Bordetella sp. 02P26C-1]|uniref:linear amide C-N hydrolase n=1 Tax=Bordetella sp. 02P26C-1 TaxID=2683195 RepID=UPI001354898D|nr:linear amide C-N hydrolase [Bordetella sp. 02P26C-1]MVW78364.1 linear amide C-N hydrolase [Bordetella sp. 02P26C-1]